MSNNDKKEKKIYVGEKLHICFEGIDGSGKTTLSKAVLKKLEELGHKVFHTSEPGNENQEASMVLRDLVLNKKYEKDIDDLSREYLLAVNRRTQYEKSKEQLSQGTFVVQDRGWVSGFAYSKAKGFDYEFIDNLNEGLTPNFKNMFDVIIYLNNNKNVEDTLKKAQEAKQEFESGDTIESKGASFQQAVRDNYCELVEMHQDSVNIIKIDIYEGEHRLTVEELVSKVMKILQKKVVMLVGNSGSGKSTLEMNLVNKHSHLFTRVVSYTSRPIDKVNRKEIEGVHYNFLNEEEFMKMKNNGEFIQYTEYGKNHYASSYASYKNRTPYTLVVIAPEKGKVLADELEEKGYDVQWVLFDISNDKIKENLLKEGKDLEDIEARFKREDNKKLFKEMNLKSSFTVTDELLNESLPQTFVNHLKEGL